MHLNLVAVILLCAIVVAICLYTVYLQVLGTRNP